MKGNDYALTFEAVKVALRQTKDGAMLTLAIHPNDFPRDLFEAWVGSRYVCALVKVDDQEKPVVKDDIAQFRRIVSRAGLLCRDPKFQYWIATQSDDEELRAEHETATEYPDRSEEGRRLEKERDRIAAEMLRRELGIESRSDLMHDGDARDLFKTIVSRFKDEMGSGMTQGDLKMLESLELDFK